MTGHAAFSYKHRIENKQGSRNSEPLMLMSPRMSHYALFIMQVLASQLHFLANRNAELAIPPLFWPVNYIKIGGHVALLCDPAVYSLYCGISV